MALSPLLWLLLPVAAASGWFLARRKRPSESDSVYGQGLRTDYFRGINYLLNEQPDKAIEVFIQVLEVDRDTVETHLALGSLYRRRGEVDRAIRIHQNLIARSSLSDDQRHEALLELGQDYLSAGLLDRAEDLLRELAESEPYRVQALRQLIDIYEQEKDWREAIAAARDLERVTGSDLGNVIAHYYCEEADRLREAGDTAGSRAVVEKALATDRNCVRASLLEGDIFRERGELEAAVAAYRRVEEQQPEYLPEIVERVRDCYTRMGDPESTKQFLSHVLERYGGITAALALAEIMRHESGQQSAAAFIVEQLRARPTVRGLDRLLELELSEAAESARDYFSILKGLTSKLMEDRPVYKCNHCGFPAKALHWRCPGCKHWNTIRPILGVEGE